MRRCGCGGWLGTARRRARLVDEIRGLVAERLLEQAGAISEGANFEALVDRVVARTSDPYTAVDALLGG